VTQKYARPPAQQLQELAVFADCSGRVMKRLSNLGTRVNIRAGQRLTTAGERGAEVLFVLAGTAVCFVGDIEEAEFGPGDFFGEVATLDGGPRTATVVARTDMDILVLNGLEFDLLIRSSPDVARRLLLAMAHRLRQANAKAVA